MARHFANGLGFALDAEDGRVAGSYRFKAKSGSRVESGEELLPMP